MTTPQTASDTLLQQFQDRFRQLKPDDKANLSQAARRRLDHLVLAGQALDQAHPDLKWSYPALREKLGGSDREASVLHRIYQTLRPVLTQDGVTYSPGSLVFELITAVDKILAEWHDRYAAPFELGLAEYAEVLADMEQTVQGLRQDLEEANRARETAESTLTDTQQQVQQLQSILSDTERQLVATRETLENREHTIQQLTQAQHAALTEQEQKLTTAHNAEIERLSQLLRQSHTELSQTRTQHKHELTTVNDQHRRERDKLTEQVRTLTQQCAAATTKNETLQDQWKEVHARIQQLETQLVLQGHAKAQLELAEKRIEELNEQLLDHDQLRERNAELNGELKQLQRQLQKAERKS